MPQCLLYALLSTHRFIAVFYKCLYSFIRTSLVTKISRQSIVQGGVLTFKKVHKCLDALKYGPACNFEFCFTPPYACLECHIFLQNKKVILIITWCPRSTMLVAFWLTDAHKTSFQDIRHDTRQVLCNRLLHDRSRNLI